MNIFDESQADEVLNQLEEQDNADTQEDDRTEKIWSQAMQRIEEANLFKLLIKSPVFAANSASPEILDAVNRKIRQFAMKELELLLGINKPEVVKEVQIKLPFDESEVQALRVLASKILKREPSTSAASVSEPVKPELKQIHIKEEQQPQVSTANQRMPKLANNKKSNKPVSKPEPQSPKSYTLPSSAGPKPIPMPTASQLMGSAAGMHITAEKGVGAKGAGQALDLVQGLIQQMTGGGSVHIDNSDPADGAGGITNMF